MKIPKPSPQGWLALLTVFFIATGIIAWLTPLEKTLGGNLRLIYLHGAWVWTGIINFSLAALAGLAGLATRNHSLQRASRAFGWSGLAFWVTYLPMSLVVMQLNWNGFFFDEPRWQVPFTFAIIGILLQVGLAVMNTRWMTALGNAIFGPVLIINLLGMDSVMHPESPVLSSSSAGIRLIFILLLISTLLLSFCLTGLWLTVFPAGRKAD